MKPRLDWIDLLRGIAIAMVVAVHTTQVVPPKSIVDPLLLEGARGVQLFFVISGFTLLLTSQQKHQGEVHAFATFWIRRFFRIAPAFWMAAILWFVSTAGVPHYWSPNGPGFLSLILTLFFLNNWFPTTHSAIVPGGWSISAEMNMYTLFPWLKKRLLDWKYSAILAASSMILAGILSALAIIYVAPLTAHPKLSISFFNSYWLPVCLPSFIAGIAAYRFVQKIAIRRRTAALLLATAIFSFITMSYLRVPLKAVLVAPIFFLVVITAQSLFKEKTLPIWITWLGKISYSAYFWHFVVLHFLTVQFDDLNKSLSKTSLGWIYSYAIVLSLTIILSSITYFLIEKPFTTLGRYLCNRVDRKLSAPPA